LPNPAEALRILDLFDEKFARWQIHHLALSGQSRHRNNLSAIEITADKDRDHSNASCGRRLGIQFVSWGVGRSGTAKQPFLKGLLTF
jgi:hypothetical protein